MKIRSTAPHRRSHIDNLPALAIITGFAVYTFVLHEWLFQVTKPSFMSSFELAERVSSLLISPLPILVIALLILGVFGSFSRLVNFRWSIPTLIPAFVIGTLFFLLADNYIYTMRRWGVATSTGVFRWLLCGAYLLILHRAYLTCVRAEVWLSGDRVKRAGWFLCILVLSSILSTVFVICTTDWRFANVEIAQTSLHPRPNIIFLGADGIESRYMSVYGFDLATTPFLERLAEESLVFEDAHADGAKSTSSITSMLTGKTPHRLQQDFPSKPLAKRDAFQHFLALLREFGYRGYQRGIAYFVDSVHLNIQRSFDYVNGRNVYNPGSSFGKGIDYIFNAERQFLANMWQGVKGRILHLVGVEEMINPILISNRYHVQGWELDRKTIVEAKEFIAQQDQPFFLHIHLMSTHCCVYSGTHSQIYTYEDLEEGSLASVDVRQRQARYFNAIRDVDLLFEEFVNWLDAEGVLEETILVISSDHNQRIGRTQAVPLFMRFPNAEHKGRRAEWVNLLRIVPTLLDYMAITPPTWVDGESLLIPPGTNQHSPTIMDSVN